MKLTYSTWGMPMLSIDDALAHIHRLGYDGVEITVTDARPFSTELNRLNAAERKRIRQLLDQYGLDLPAIAGHTDLMAPDPDVYARNLGRLRATIDLALEWAGPDGVPAVNTTSGGSKDEWETGKSLFVNRLGELVAYGQQRGVTIAVEPHVSSMLDRPDRALWLLQQIRSDYLKLCFDISHFEVVEGIPMAESVRLMAPHSVFTHVKDQRGIYPNHEFLVPGEGPFDYVAYLKEMDKVGYQGHIGVEVSFMVQDRPSYDPYWAAELAYRTLSNAFLEAGLRRG